MLLFKVYVRSYEDFLNPCTPNLITLLSASGGFLSVLSGGTITAKSIYGRVTPATDYTVDFTGNN
jgi:hypothetical protein